MRSLPRQLLTDRCAGSVALAALVAVLVFGWTVADVGASDASDRLEADGSALVLAGDATDPGLHAVQPPNPARTRTVVMIVLLMVIAACSTSRLGPRRRRGDAAFALATGTLATSGPRAPPARVV
jgi:hypothetical protein